MGNASADGFTGSNLGTFIKKFSLPDSDIWFVMVVWLAYNGRRRAHKTEPDRCPVDKLGGHFGGKGDMPRVIVAALTFEVSTGINKG